MTRSAVLFAFFGPWATAFLCLSQLPAIAAAEPGAGFVTGPRLAQVLEQPVTAAWSNLPFREVVASFSDTQRVATLVDRRIDADAAFSLTITGDPLRIAILKIAERKGVSSSMLGPLVYFGPKEAAETLRTLSALRRDDAGKLPPGARKLLTQSRPLSWEDLAEPRKLAAELAKEARVEVQGLDRIPHDLWRAGRLPPLIWTDRLTILLVQFGLTFDIAADGRTVSIVPVPEIVEIQRKYAAGEQPEMRAKKLASLAPKARVSVAGEKLVVVGRMEDHDEIAQLLSGRQVRTTTVKAGKELYKLNVERLPLEKVLSQLGAMLKLEVKIEQQAIRAAGVSLDQLITFQVQNATLDDLLTAAVEGTGLTFERNEKTVIIKPK